jgi:hypothetical protein
MIYLPQSSFALCTARKGTTNASQWLTLILLANWKKKEVSDFADLFKCSLLGFSLVFDI